MTRKSATSRADAIEAAERTYEQAAASIGNEYRNNLAMGMPQHEAEVVWYEQHAEAKAIYGEELDFIDQVYGPSPNIDR